jgi:hypothetical protein
MPVNDVAAVTSMLLTNRAAMQVEKVRKVAPLIFNLLASGPFEAVAR